MANKDTNPVHAPETDVQVLTGSFTGVNGSSPTAASCKGIVSSATRTAEGIWTLVLRRKFPANARLFAAVTVQGADADRAFFAALNLTAGTATVEAYTVSDAADDCDAKVIEVLIVARNSTSRRAR